MCLILLAWQSHPRFPLIVAANRDEFFARPTAPAWFWNDAPEVFGGRDLEAGGTWLGITRQGRFAALTNYRDPARQVAGKRSRGALVAGFLGGSDSPADFARRAAAEGEACNGYNLLLADPHELHYVSNVDGQPRRLAPGLYGLSNHLLDTPWPKVARSRTVLAQAMTALPDVEPLFAMLRDETIAADEHLPQTGVGLEWERLLSAAFVRSPGYGTRSSTVLAVGADGFVEFEERSHGPDGLAAGTVRSRFKLVAQEPGTS